MDISELTPKEHTFEILHPKTDEEIGIRVTIMSADDPRIAPNVREIRDSALAKRQRGKALKSKDIDQNHINLVAKAIAGWEWYGDVDFKGEKPDFNEKNVKDVLKNLPWFLDQVDEEINDQKNFF